MNLLTEVVIWCIYAQGQTATKDESVATLQSPPQQPLVSWQSIRFM